MLLDTYTWPPFQEGQAIAPHFVMVFHPVQTDARQLWAALGISHMSHSWCAEIPFGLPTAYRPNGFLTERDGRSYLQIWKKLPNSRLELTVRQKAIFPLIDLTSKGILSFCGYGSKPARHICVRDWRYLNAEDTKAIASNLSTALRSGQSVYLP